MLSSGHTYNRYLVCAILHTNWCRIILKAISHLHMISYKYCLDNVYLILDMFIIDKLIEIIYLIH